MPTAAAKAAMTLRRSRRAFTVVAVAALVCQLLPEVQVTDLSQGSEAFAVPANIVQGQRIGLATETSLAGSASYFAGNDMLGRAEARTHRAAAPLLTSAEISTKVMNAMGAGAVAAVIQAALSAVAEPIVNRVLVRRMKLMDAVRDVTPSMMLKFFKTTLTTNLLKFPFFEAINMFCSLLPISGAVRGLFTGFVFTTATLPVTNFRYRKSMQLEVNCGNIYEAYFPTVIRDMAYATVRNYSTMGVLAAFPGWKITSPQLMFIVVILGCLGSAPFNEWRGFLLQAKGKELSFKDFFKPANFVRSTSLGAFNQGTALAVGYLCAPPVQRFVAGLMAGH
ncbi:unnamed protein product [Polarella glacialis]|uniref:ADP,ATP carrier protein n=1 Tax=Polarella glacialis TaxID=89957 RepID=A0A813H1J8_POLGL|nr:unnamed protein product [Polarella glacialis]